MAYRIVVPTENIEDSELKIRMDQPSNNIWIGPQVHAVAYSIRGGKLLNIVLLVPDDLPEDVAKARGDLDEMRRMFQDWDPMQEIYSSLSLASLLILVSRLSQFLDNVQNADRWRLHHRKKSPLALPIAINTIALILIKRNSHTLGALAECIGYFCYDGRLLPTNSAIYGPGRELIL